MAQDHTSLWEQADNRLKHILKEGHHASTDDAARVFSLFIRFPFDHLAVLCSYSIWFQALALDLMDALCTMAKVTHHT